MIMHTVFDVISALGAYEIILYGILELKTLIDSKSVKFGPLFKPKNVPKRRDFANVNETKTAKNHNTAFKIHVLCSSSWRLGGFKIYIKHSKLYVTFYFYYSY